MSKEATNIEIDGQVRRLGCLSPVLLGGKLRSNTPTMKTGGPVWTVGDIKPIDRRKTFGSGWIKDQKQFGSCNGWATSTVQEKERFLNGQLHVELSGSSVYAMINGGQDNGSQLHDGQEEIINTGALPASVSSADQIYKNQYSAETWKNAARFRAQEAFVIEDELDLQTALMNGFMPVVAVHVDNGFNSVGVDGVSRGGQGPGNHSIHLDGLKWSDKLGCWCYDLVNSWGSSWNDQGRIFITWDKHLKVTRQYHEFYAVRGSVDDPQGINPPQAA